MATYIRPNNKDHLRPYGKVTGTRAKFHKMKRKPPIPKGVRMNKRSKSLPSSEFYVLLEEDEDDVASSLFADGLNQIDSLPGSSMLTETLPPDYDMQPRTTLADTGLVQEKILPADSLLLETLPASDHILPNNTLQADTDADLQTEMVDTQNESLPKTYILSAVVDKHLLLLAGQITESVKSIESGDFSASLSTVGITTTEEKSEPQAMSILKIQPGPLEILPYTMMIEATLSYGEDSTESPSYVNTPSYPIKYRKESYTFWIDLLSKDELMKMKGDKLALNYKIILSPK